MREMHSVGPRVLIAGIGNVLRGDDGFGPAVIQELQCSCELLGSVRCIEFGIGGIGLVHELMDGYDALILIDAVDRGGLPGTLYTLEPQVPDLLDIPERERHDLTGDMHQAVPNRALVLARAAGVLPPTVWMIGCQPADTDELVLNVSPSVRNAVSTAVGLVLSLLSSLEIPSQVPRSEDSP